MPSLPIPVFSALVLAFVALHLCHRSGRITPLALLAALFATQTVIISLAQHYLVPGMRWVQPVTAMMIPPAAWLAYLVTTTRALRLSDLLHLAAPLSALGLLLSVPSFLDILVPGAFAVYGIILIGHAWQGPDAQPRVALAKAEMPARIWLFIGASLVASAFSDAAIVLVQILGAGHWRPWMVSLFSVGTLLVIGALSLSEYLDPEEPQPETPDPTPATPDTDIWDRVEHYMADSRPFLDPDLTLAKLSRRLGIPAKTLSATINRATGENVSRYVNRARIEAAKTELLGGQPVTTAMLASGFNTKSNFNREFLRLTGQSPSKWLAEQG